MPIDPTFRAEVQAFSTKEGMDASLVEATRQEGLFQGQDVQEVDVNSQLADAAEEMSFAASEKVEKKLSERKAGSKEALKSAAMELAEQYVNMMAESQAPRKLHEFLDALKGRGEKVTEGEIRQLVGEHFGDSSDQFAALGFAEESLARQTGQTELLAKIKNVKALLLNEAGPAIRAGLNIAADVLAYAKKGLEGPEALRDLYRFSILGGQKIVPIYNAIMARYGVAQFSHSLDFLLRAASSDLEGKLMGSSLDSVQLNNAVDDIFNVQSLGNAHRSFGDLLDQVRRLFPS